MLTLADLARLVAQFLEPPPFYKCFSSRSRVVFRVPVVQEGSIHVLNGSRFALYGDQQLLLFDMAALQQWSYANVPQCDLVSGQLVVGERVLAWSDQPLWLTWTPGNVRRPLADYTLHTNQTELWLSRSAAWTSERVPMSTFLAAQVQQGVVYVCTDACLYRLQGRAWTTVITGTSPYDQAVFCHAGEMMAVLQDTSLLIVRCKDGQRVRQEAMHFIKQTEYLLTLFYESGTRAQFDVGTGKLCKPTSLMIEGAMMGYGSNHGMLISSETEWGTLRPPQVARRHFRQRLAFDVGRRTLRARMRPRYSLDAPR
jgi:hypothetical protein